MTITQQQAIEALERVYADATHAAFTDRNLVRQYIEQSTAQPQAVVPAPPQEFESAQGRALASAWAEGWAQCRDAEYVGEEAQDEAFNQSATLAQCLHADQTRFQGGLSNDQLRRAWSAKLPNVIPTDEQLTAFALGIESVAQPSAQAERAPVVQAVQAGEYPPLPIYVASRASLDARPAMWRNLRAQGWPINSTWIDEAGPEETKSFPELWSRIQAEVTAACGVILYAEPDDFPLKGAYIEVGMAMGQGKPIAVVLPGVKIELPHVRPVGSWVRHPLVKICATLDEARAYVDADRASSGAAQAVRMLTDADCREYLNGSWLTKDQDDAIAAFCAVNAGRTIPADGVIGGV